MMRLSITSSIWLVVALLAAIFDWGDKVYCMAMGASFLYDVGDEIVKALREKR